MRQPGTRDLPEKCIFAGARHLDLVIRATEGRSEWFCAERTAQELRRAGEFVRVLKVREPSVATGWRTALWAKADIQLRAGRTDEALDLVRPDNDGRISQTVCRHFVELLTKAGRVDEAVGLLVPHIGEPWIRTALVEITEGEERDERVLELIAPHAEAARRARDEGPVGRRRPPSSSVPGPPTPARRSVTLAGRGGSYRHRPVHRRR
ncbi:hypothetical protein [Streptomyces sp. NPDC020571]|uniref:hypothetical protein n=1 Tax=Streptomyces sp. NPDC020571 TaxID=3365079 RepID=UPI0037AB5419